MFIALIKIVFELIGGRFRFGLATMNDYTSYNYSGHPAKECVWGCVCACACVLCVVCFRVCVGLY